MTTGPGASTRALHALWARLENEHHRLAAAIEEARSRGADVRPMRGRQAQLLLDINAVVADIRDAPASSLEDFLALLDVAIEHEFDLIADIAYYGPQDYPMMMRFLKGLAELAPGFEFNSLRRWLSLPGQLDEIKSSTAPFAPSASRGSTVQIIRIDRPQSRRTSSTSLAKPRKPADVSRDP